MPDNERPLVIGLGEVLWDLLPEGKQFGGAPTNFAYHAKQFGADARVVSCVGDDDLGREILERLDRLGLDRQFVAVDPHRPTGTVSIAVDGDGKPDYIIHEDVAWDHIPVLPGLEELALRADGVCFGSLAQRSSMSHNTINRFLEATSERCLRIFDINLRQHYYTTEIIQESLEQANVLKINDEELPVVAELLLIEGDLHAVMHTLIDRYALQAIALTKGADGSELVGRDVRATQPGAEVEVADTVGAGDAFAAVLAMGLLRGLDLETINAHAARVAAYVCTQAGATPEMPEELRRLGES